MLDHLVRDRQRTEEKLAIQRQINTERKRALKARIELAAAKKESLFSTKFSSRRPASARNFLAVTASTRNRDGFLALARLRRVMLCIVPFRVAHRLYDRVGLFGWIEKLVLWMIVRKNV